MRARADRATELERLAWGWAAVPVVSLGLLSWLPFLYAALRTRALRLVRENPQRAIALGVGRPDVPGSFDGGLVDVNHASAEALATLPGIDAPTAKRVTDLRESSNGFSSPEDLDLVLNLEPGTLA